ncbi:MAG: terminase family protein [Dehalococcoidia bacterium]
MPEAEVRQLLVDLDAAARAVKFGKFYTYFPDEGPLRRELYDKHTEFFAAGAKYTERLFLAANRVGKTVAGSYEGTAHLTGKYPHWWKGRVFHRPIRMWAAGDFNETTRDVIQKEMLGQVEWHGEKKGVDGAGMIPRDLINQSSITWKAGVPDLIDTVRIKHELGGESVLGLKSYQQGRRSFQGTAQDVIWTDEEPPMEVYNEMLIRLMTTGGLAMLTFTPLMGWTDVVESFMPEQHVN